MLNQVKSGNPVLNPAVCSGDDDVYDGPSSVEAEANSSDGGFDDLDMGDIPEPSYPLSNPRRNSADCDHQVNEASKMSKNVKKMSKIRIVTTFSLTYAGFRCPP
jgi:hypothetical protein